MEHKFAGLQGFTPEQLFFIGAGQVWCDRKTEENTLIMALTDAHAPHQFRQVAQELYESILISL